MISVAFFALGTAGDVVPLLTVAELTSDILAKRGKLEYEAPVSDDAETPYNKLFLADYLCRFAFEFQKGKNYHATSENEERPVVDAVTLQSVTESWRFRNSDYLQQLIDKACSVVVFVSHEELLRKMVEVELCDCVGKADSADGEWSCCDSLKIDKHRSNLLYLYLPFGSLRSTLNSSWTLPEARQIVNFAEFVNKKLHPLKLVCFNFFTTLVWHVAEKFKWASVLLSPCVAPSKMPNEFEKAFREEFPDVAEILDARILTADKTSNLVKGKISMQENLMCNMERLSGKLHMEEITWDDIRHWMWRLCLSDHGEIREKVCEMPSALFGSPSRPLLPFAPPVIYLFGDVMSSQDISLKYSSNLFVLPYPSPPRLASERTRVTFRGLCIRNPYVPIFSTDAHSEDIHIKELLDLWIYRNSDASYNLSATFFIYVTFGSMHALELKLIPSTQCLVRFLSRVASFWNKTNIWRRSIAKTRNISLPNICFLLHTPWTSCNMLDDNCPRHVAFDKVKAASVVVLEGNLSVPLILSHHTFGGVVCHGGVGTVSSILQCFRMRLQKRMQDESNHQCRDIGHLANTPKILVMPRMFDQESLGKCIANDNLGATMSQNDATSILFNLIDEAELKFSNTLSRCFFGCPMLEHNE